MKTYSIGDKYDPYDSYVVVGFLGSGEVKSIERRVIIPNRSDSHLEDGAVEISYYQGIYVRPVDQATGKPRKGSRKELIERAYLGNEVRRTEIGAFTNVWQA